MLEFVFTSSKHRKLRARIKSSPTYGKWLDNCRALDVSQGRDLWQLTVTDSVAARYNWKFIRELIRDLRACRRDVDLVKAMAALQACTRKNVGGVMSTELFAFTNTGEPKQIVMDFINEVTLTLEWVTEQVGSKEGRTEEFIDTPESEFHASLLQWATLGLMGGGGGGGSTGTTPSNSGSTTPVQANSPKRPERPAASIAAPADLLKTRQVVKTFLKRARAAYGRTALCLSGGAAMGT